MKVTVQQLAQALSEEFIRDAWGDLDTYLVQMIADGDYTKDDAQFKDAEELKKLLERVVIKLSAACDKTSCREIRLRRSR